jgi:zinc protease
MKKALAYFISAVLFLAFSPCEATALEAKRKVLPSGLVVLHAENHNLPVVMLTLLVRAGSLDEPPEKAGLAFLTAALMREGTANRTSTRISEEVDFIGAGLGVSAGADYSTVTLSVLKKHLEKGFEIFSDVLLNPTFPPREISRIKEQTRASLKQREESPAFLASRAFNREVFGPHPYGRLLEGSPETIEAVTRDDMAGFHSEYFVPGNSILSVAGDITGKELDRAINKYLVGWRRKPVPAGTHPSPPPPSHHVVRIDRDLTQANILLGHLGARRDNPDHYALSVMNYILGGGGFSSRLMDSIRDRMGLAYSVYSSFSSNKDAGAFRVSVQTKNASASTVIEEILRQIRAVMEEKVAVEELEDAKAYFIGSFPRRLDTNRKIADFMGVVEFYGLGLDYPEKYPSYIMSVTRDDVLRVASKYLHPENYVLVVVAKQSEAALEDTGP